MKISEEYRALALDALRGKWKTAVLAGIIASAFGANIVSGSSSITSRSNQDSSFSILAVGTPQNGSVKGAAVGKTIRHTADVYGTSLAEIMRRHLHFLITLHQHFHAFQGINILLSLTEVDGFVSIL